MSLFLAFFPNLIKLSKIQTAAKIREKRFIEETLKLDWSKSLKIENQKMNQFLKSLKNDFKYDEH